MGELQIHLERPEEYRAAEELVRDAFWDVYQPGCNEHYVVHLLRKDHSFRPELSFTAWKNGQLAGCIYYSDAVVSTPDGRNIPVLTLGPVAVAPQFQKQGIGTALIEHTKRLASEAGHRAIVLFGNPAYYRRFGFEPGEKYSISDGEGNFNDALQILVFQSAALDGISGRLSDNPLFMIDPAKTAVFDATFPPRKKHAFPTQIFLCAGNIQPAAEGDFEEIYEIINDAASAYKGIIPDDRWKEPYMPREELREQIADGVVFYGYSVNGLLLGVMGIQDKGEVFLIRHAYIRTVCRNLGIGGKLLEYLHGPAGKPMLIGTWADASWAIRFYEKNGFRRVTDVEQKNALLRKFWNIPQRQVETSVVLTDTETCRKGKPLMTDLLQKAEAKQKEAWKSH